MRRDCSPRTTKRSACGRVSGACSKRREIAFPQFTANREIGLPKEKLKRKAQHKDHSSGKLQSFQDWHRRRCSAGSLVLQEWPRSPSRGPEPHGARHCTHTEHKELTIESIRQETTAGDSHGGEQGNKEAAWVSSSRAHGTCLSAPAAEHLAGEF